MKNITLVFTCIMLSNASMYGMDLVVKMDSTPDSRKRNHSATESTDEKDARSSKKAKTSTKKNKRKKACWGEKTKKHICETCGKKWISLSALTNHIRSHTGQRPFKCTFPDCDSSFKLRGDLKKHTRTHTGEKPFECTFSGCTRRFAQKSNMEKHRKRHMNDSKNTSTPSTTVSTATSAFVLTSHPHETARETSSDSLSISQSLSDSDGIPMPDDSETDFSLTTTTDDLDETDQPLSILTTVTEERNSILEPSSLSMPLNYTDEKRFQCIVCDKRFKKQIGLREHEQEHIKNMSSTSSITTTPLASHSHEIASGLWSSAEGQS